MNQERWQEIKRIYNSALELDSGRRREFVREACGGDIKLQEEVESLLARQNQAGDFLNEPAVELEARAIATAERAADFAGQMLLHYRVIEKIGEGGMGVVYLAEDSHLKRQVAIKVLPESFSSDPERIARFDREAKLLASLSHQNIAGIFGLEEASGQRFIAMEYVHGQTLAGRIAKRPLPVDDALDICRQIAEGLEAAHEKGIIHRDLKPSNVMISSDGKVKILDFGLAKAFAAETIDVDLSHSPTITEAMTHPGMLLGTAAYMSPEQAKGKPVDKRADIWAFGCILYECLTGKRAFEAATVSETIAAIITHSPSWANLPAAVPGGIRDLLIRCLDKDPRNRLHDIADARIEIERAHQAASGDAANTPTRPRKKGWRIALAASFLIAAVALFFVLAPGFLRQAPVDLGSYTYTPFAVEAAQETLGAWSPDGRSIAYLKEFAGANRWEWHLMVRSLDSPTPTRLTRTPPGLSQWVQPSWSADGSRIYYVARSAVWSVSAAGGEPEPVFPGKKGLGIWYASLSPDGVTLAFWRQVKREDGLHHSVWISSPPGSEPRPYEPQILHTPHVFAPMPLAFSPDGSRLGVCFLNSDIGARELALLPWPDRSQEASSRSFSNIFWSSRSPWFSWTPDGRHIIFSNKQRLWVGEIRTGGIRGLTTAEGEEQPSVSPEGRRILLTRRSTDFNIIQLPLDGSPPVPWLASARQEHSPSWSRSGDRMAYGTDRRGGQEVWLRDARGEWERPIVAQENNPDSRPSVVAPALSPDGTRVAYLRLAGKTGGGLWISSVESGRPAPAFPGSDQVYSAPAWSPDGLLLACYAWGENGLPRILVARPGSQEPPRVLPYIVYPQLVPSWSPDGQRIASGGELNPSEGKASILISSPDGSSHKTFPTPERIWVFENFVFWSPDGATLYFATSLNGGARLWALEIASGRWRKLADWGERVRFGPAGNLVTGSISPDGKSVMTTAEVTSSDLWILEGFPSLSDKRPAWLKRLSRLISP